ncbi:16S ribosomal RNA methyltransferase A, partial [Halobium palmae]
MTEPDGTVGDDRADSFRDPDRLIRRAGLRGDPDQDQHFLVDDRVLDRIPGYLPEDADASHLLEIGAGTGALTDRDRHRGRRRALSHGGQAGEGVDAGDRR